MSDGVLTFGDLFDDVANAMSCNDVTEILSKYPRHGFCIMVAVRNGRPFSLETVNGLFECAKNTPQDWRFDFIRQLWPLYEELIEASNGKLFWATEEDDVRIDLREITLSPDMPFAAKEVVNKIRHIATGTPGLADVEKEFNWLTPYVATGTIKPAKR